MCTVTISCPLLLAVIKILLTATDCSGNSMTKVVHKTQNVTQHTFQVPNISASLFDIWWTVKVEKSHKCLSSWTSAWVGITQKGLGISTKWPLK